MLIDKAFEIIPKHQSFKLCINLLKKILQLLIGFLLIAMTLNLDVTLDGYANTLTTQVLDYLMLIPFLINLLLAMNAAAYAMTSAQRI